MSDVELSINERVNSQLYSDVVNSYVDINNVISRRNIVSGSFKESVSQCEDMTLNNLNSSAGQTLFTRFLLTPAMRNATLLQLAQIYFQYQIKAGTLGFIFKKYTTETDAEGADDVTKKDITNGTIVEHLKCKLLYDTGFLISSMVSLCLGPDSKVTTENFNYQQSILTLNSLPDFSTENSTSESTLKALVEDENFHGVGSGLLDFNFNDYNNATNPTGLTGIAGYDTTGIMPINIDISIEGNIDLNKGNPLFHNFPVITRNMGNLYLKLQMENFLRELKIVYLNKKRMPVSISGALDINLQGKVLVNATPSKTNWNDIDSPNATLSSNGTDNKFTGVATVASAKGGNIEYLPYQRLPADKADWIFLDGSLYKVRLVVCKAAPAGAAAAFNSFDYGIANIRDVNWTRCEIRKTEFDIEDFDDIVASQGKAGTYKFPVHLWRSKNFDQTNAASSSANYLQTTIAAPNIDRMFFCEPLTTWNYTFLPTLPTTDITPLLFNNTVLPRTEDCLNSRVIERIFSVYTDTDKYSPSADLYNSTNVPTKHKVLYTKGANTYGGTGAFCALQRGYQNAGKNNAKSYAPVLIPNKFAYAIELNEGGCFRRGFNSVIDKMYSQNVPCALQQSLTTSGPIYSGSDYATVADEEAALASWKTWNAYASYLNMDKSGATGSVHCLCDYIFKMSFDNFGMLTDFEVSPYA